jgi:serine/threonine-protein kinase
MSGSRALSAQAKAAEQRGDFEEAIRLFVQAHELEEAARVLVAHGDFSRAGRLLFRAVGLPLDRMGEADAAQRKLAIKAGICLAKANEVSHAVALFVAAGDAQRAIETLSRAGDTAGAARLRAQLTGGSETRMGMQSGQASAGKYVDGRRLEERGDPEAALVHYIQAKAFADAGRVARSLGRFVQAGELFEEGGQFYEAAVCFHDSGDLRRCFSVIVRVPREHPRYRASCVKAVALAAQFGELGFELDQLMSRFVSSGPQTQEELETFFTLGRLYQQVGFPENARECYRKIVERQPNHAAASLLRDLEQATRGSNMVYDRIMREDSAFRGEGTTGRHRSLDEPISSTFAVRAELDALPELPELPRTGTGPRPAPPPQGTPVAPPRATALAPASPAPAAQAAPARAAPAKAGPAETQYAVGEAPKPARQSGAPTAIETPNAPLQFNLTVGSVIAERYRLEKQLGQGGTAVVFRATDLELEEEVAIKVFTLAVDDPDILRRFKQELSVARKLSHPNIVRLHDIGAHGGFRFLTMEVLQGEDLAGAMAHGQLSQQRALDYLMQAASGLAMAHAAGIVHRDIKPENFFVTTQGVLKVMDFGIAKKQSAQKRTQAGFIAGTPPYMSPEQINGFADVTSLADMYSLGVVAYEMFTGVLPFSHEELMPLLVMHLTQLPEPPVTHNPSLPAELNDLILRLLEKDPAQRVPSMNELIDLLAKVRPLLSRSILTL